jgi:mRNA-degrading endonuclease HigB of HigAB toxin-antitoxin module
MEIFKFPEEIQQIYSAKYWKDNEIIFSAKGNGFVDIYTIQIKDKGSQKNYK